MSEVGDKKVVSAVVAVVQDNIFLRKVNYLMAKFITDNGIFNYASSGKQEYRSVLKYFKTAALEELMKNGYEMGINTPWGEEVTKLYRHKELSNRYDDEEDVDLDEEYYNEDIKNE